MVAGDQTNPVYTAEIAVDERVARPRLLGGALGKAEMPHGVLLPGVGFQESVLFPRARLPVLPPRAEHELPRNARWTRQVDDADLALLHVFAADSRSRGRKTDEKAEEGSQP